MENADAMSLKFRTKLMNNMISKLISKLLYTKLGVKIDIQLDNLDIGMQDGETAVRANVVAKLDNKVFDMISKKLTDN